MRQALLLIQPSGLCCDHSGAKDEAGDVLLHRQRQYVPWPMSPFFSPSSLVRQPDRGRRGSVTWRQPVRPADGCLRVRAAVRHHGTTSIRSTAGVYSVRVHTYGTYLLRLATLTAPLRMGSRTAAADSLVISVPSPDHLSCPSSFTVLGVWCWRHRAFTGRSSAPRYVTSRTAHRAP